MNRRLRLALILLATGLVAAWLWRPAKFMWDVAALERACGGRVWVHAIKPGWMSEPWEEKVRRLAIDKLENKGAAIVAAANLALGGKIDSFTLDGGTFHRHAPEVVARFPNLRGALFLKTDITVAEMTQLCTDLRSCPTLDDIMLRGESLTDAAIAPLAGHPGLNRLRIHLSSVTSRSAGTFASMPALSYLEIAVSGEKDRIADLQELTARLPKVRVAIW